jgi:Flp pilus assembly protein TadD
MSSDASITNSRTSPPLPMPLGRRSRSRPTTRRSTGTWPWHSLGGDVDGAIREYEAAIELKPGDSDYPNALGNTFYDEGWFAEAEAAYRKAIALAPEGALMHRNLGSVLQQQERFDGAIEEFRRVIALAPRDAMAQNYLGVALWSRDPLDPEALAAYRAAIALDPKVLEPFYNLAVALHDRAASAESEPTRTSPTQRSAGGACLPTGASRGGTAVQARCLKRQLSFPVSMISQ